MGLRASVTRNPCRRFARRTPARASLRVLLLTILERIDTMAVDFARIDADEAKIVALIPALQASLAAANASNAANDPAAVQTHLDALATALEGVLPGPAAVPAPPGCARRASRRGPDHIGTCQHYPWRPGDLIGRGGPQGPPYR